MVETRVTVCSIAMQNPVMPASGACAFGEPLARYFDLNRLGAFCGKGTTAAPRFGNSMPRIAEAPSGMINSVGLENPGIDAVLAHDLPTLRTIYKGPFIANASGFSVDEYVAVCAAFDKNPLVDAIEVNVSCPNVKHGGLTFGTTPEGASEVTRAVRAAVTKPIFVKLSPNVTDIVPIATACMEAGADGLTLINTPLAMRIDLKTMKPVLQNTFGGLSGPAIFPIALRMVFQVYRALKVPILGVGGIATARDVIEMMLAGAAAVQVGAAGLQDPMAWVRIIDELPIEMAKLGIASLQEIVGGAHA